jgi:cysteine-rich secretory family protein
MGCLVRQSAVLAAIALLAVVPTAAASDRTFSDSAAVQWLNAFRQASGIPGHVTQNPAWSSKCLRHVRWMERNNALAHDETPGTPGYSTAGDWAGSNAVLAAGVPWTASHLPWLTAPLHLAQLLAPNLTEVGVAYERGWACATTWPGYTSGDGQPAIYSYPANDARGVPTRMIASEAPFSPGQFVGIPAGGETGPYLYVFADGAWSAGRPHVISATLSAVGGAPVAVRHVDGTTPQVGMYLPPGSGMVIPVRPLSGATTYVATVMLGNGAETKTLRWQFRT